MQEEHNLASAELAQLLAEQKELPDRSLQEALREGEQLQALQKQLAELRAGPLDLSAQMFAGRRLKAIDIQGLSASSRDELRAKLPVHVGDTLAADSMEKVNAAVKQFDEHLGLSMFTASDGQVKIRIAAHGSSNSLEPPQ